MFSTSSICTIRTIVTDPMSNLLDFGSWAAGLLLLVFLGSSFLMIWRLEIMTGKGMEGTVLGTLVMPYCSGMGNLIFVVVLGLGGGPGKEVMVNCLVNNVTNLTLLLGLPAVIWGMTVIPRKRVRVREARIHRINRLSLLFTMTAVLFFGGVVWALGRDGALDLGDGLVLIGMFLFWQCVHVFEVLKTNVREAKQMPWTLLIDFLLLGVGTYGIYISVEGLVQWLSVIESGFVSSSHLGWLSGWLMVLPNALLALYYGWRRRADVVYTSQIGDGHICIPLCLGIFCLFDTISMPAFFDLGIAIILGSVALHFAFILLLGRLPRFVGGLLIALYGGFVCAGLIG